MPSLHDLQHAFAAAVLAEDGAAPAFATTGPGNAIERIAIYRRAMFANYRGALAATYPVVKKLVGAPFFDGAVDAFVRAHPSRSGDLNVYGSEFGAFLAGYPPAAELPYLPDVAQLEWAIDEVGRAADDASAPSEVLAAFAAIAPSELPEIRVVPAQACRITASRFPILRIWRINQDDAPPDARASLDEGGVAVLVRRDARGISLTALTPGEQAWLAALGTAATLGAAIDAARAADESFDLATALRERIADGTIAAVIAECRYTPDIPRSGRDGDARTSGMIA
jgi:hypothetical protein